MQDRPSEHPVHLVPAAIVSRRSIVSLTAKFAAGAALAVIAGDRLAHGAAAQDNEIILTATASEVGARPGSAYAQGYAALAAADQDAGATTEAGVMISTPAASSAPPSSGTSGGGVTVPVPPSSSHKG